jgi:DNA polymerase (family 10)
MAEAAQARGYEYMAPTDHSRRVAMTHGLDPARLARQIHEIDRLNGNSGILRSFGVSRSIS